MKSVQIRSVHIRTEYTKNGPEKSPYLDTFHALFNIETLIHFLFLHCPHFPSEIGSSTETKLKKTDENIKYILLYSDVCLLSATNTDMLNTYDEYILPIKIFLSRLMTVPTIIHKIFEINSSFHVK